MRPLAAAMVKRKSITMLEVVGSVALASAMLGAAVAFASLIVVGNL
ncbi:hypothetical protein WDZ92_35310 [Nostoc sp. NIES-2111]